MIGIIARHEAASLLRSMQVWIITALLAALFGFQFLKQLEEFLAIQTQLALQDHPVGLTGYMSVRYLEPLALVFTLVAPLFAMRSFSDEFRHHTYALWQSSPVSATSLALGKFCGVYAVLLLVNLLAIGLLAAMQWLTPIDGSMLLSAGLGLALCTAACTACGIYFSSLTQHSLIAIIASLALLFISWMSGSVGAGILPLQGFVDLSIASHLRGFFQGFVQTRDIAFFILMTLLFLGLTIVRLDAIRQKGPL